MITATKTPTAKQSKQTTAKQAEKSPARHTGQQSPQPTGKTGAKQAKPTQTEFTKFFVEQLQDIYWAEKHLTKGLKKMQMAATSPRLAEAFRKHCADSEKQTAVLEQLFELMGEKPKGKRCEAMAGLVTEAEEMIEDTEANSLVRDAGLILAAQKAEHYEIATYGTLKALAAYLPQKRVQKLLDTLLRDEKHTDQLLTALAEEFVNESASVE